jgi:hypothetical protein
VQNGKVTRIFRSDHPCRFVYHLPVGGVASMKAGFACLIVLLAACAASGVRAGEDTITLTNGRTYVGEITGDDAQTVTLKEKSGEQRAILKARIAKIVRTGDADNPPKPIEFKGLRVATPGEQPPPQQPQTPNVRPPLPGQAARAPETLRVHSNDETLALVKDLGAPQPQRRQAAAEKILRDKRNEALPLMLAMLHPKQPTDEYTRIGILRTLADCTPLSVQAAETIGYVAMNDPYPEVRREACATIRKTGDDRSLREIMKSANTEHNGTRKALAAVIHEIDDERMLLALIGALPQPQVSANFSEPQGLDRPAYNLPVGPGGVSIPIFLPQGDVAGVASDLETPALHILRDVAGKNMGNLSGGWMNWYREKTGEIGVDDRNDQYERRSMRDRMNR